MKALSILISCVLITGLIYADSSYIKEGSIGKVNTIKANNKKVVNALEYRAMKDWIGEKFIFLPQQLDDYREYLWFQGGSGPYGHPKYEECVGRIGTVTAVNSKKITLTMDDNGKEYIGESLLGDDVSGIAPVLDLDYARNNLSGKTLWNKMSKLEIYDEQANTVKLIEIKKYLPLKVIDVRAGWYNTRPIRLILQTPTGEEGYIDISLSGTNVPPAYHVSSTIEYHFFTVDPRKKYKWSKKIWSAIENERVFIGMNKEQAKMSWGYPESINKTSTVYGTHEQWVYDGGYLYFDNQILRSIQN